MQTKLARNVFSAPWEFPWSVCKKRLWVELGIFLGDFNFDILLTVPDELGELFQARWTQTKLPRIFFNALWEFLSKFGQKAFMSRILHFILVISTLIFCPLCLMLSSFCVAFFVGGLPHKKGVCIRSLVFNRFNHFDSKWRVKYAALFVVGALSHAIWMQRKLSRNFFAALCGSFLQYFAKNVYEPNFALFLVISTLIFCSLCLMFSMFCVLFFVGGLPHKKGVCIRSLVLNCCNLFDSKWRVNYLVLFVVSAVSHAIRMQITFSRIFFQCFLGVSSKFLQRVFMSQILHFFSWFQLWYFAYSAWSFSFFVFRFLSGIYFIKRVFAYEV